MKRKLAAFLVCVALGATSHLPRVFGQAASHALSPGQAALERKDYVEAMGLLDGELKADPKNEALLEAKVDALMGLGRFWEAGQAASSLMSSHPSMRYRTGQCLMAMGRVPEAAQVWSPLRSDPAWSGKAYACLVTALLAVGQEKDALDLLREGLAKAPPPATELLRLSVELEPSSEAAPLDLLETADPQGKEAYETLRRLRAAAGGNLREVSLTGELPAVIALGDAPVPADPTGSVSASPRVARKPAPSAQRFGSGTYSKIPPGIKFYAEAEAPNELYEQRRVVVPVAFDGGNKAALALDSGCPDVMLSPDTAKKLDLKPLGARKAWTLGLDQPEDYDVVLIKSMRVGPLEFKNVPAVVLKAKQGLWGELGGVLPVRLLKNWALHYDRRGGKLTLYHSGTKPEAVLGQGTFRVKVLWSEGLPFAQAKVQEKPSCFMLLGTGSSFSYLEAARLADLGLGAATTRYGVQTDRGHVGPISSGVAEGAEITLGSSMIHMRAVRTADLCPESDLDCCGVLGRDILDLFDIFLDYGADTLALKGYDKGK